ncbi:glycosyltransferase family 9 protein [candidate division WOR-3 bacterium]|nr:glycosyltransferase family 9 protein [candidate division WOR-3 bacterium]
MRTNNIFFPTQKRILIIKQRGIGDVILSTPAIRTIRKYFRFAKVTLILDTQSVELFTDDQDIDEIVEVKKGIVGIVNVVRRIRGKYSLVFDLISTPFSLILSLLSGAKMRIGWSKPKRFRGRFYSHPVDISESIPAIDSNLRAVTRLGMEPITRKVSIILSEEERRKFKKEYYKQLSLDIKRLTVAIHPGCLFETKRWFPEKFAQLADLLQENEYQVVITGSKAEADVIEKIKMLSNKDLAYLPPVSLREFAYFLSNIDLLITNDGGPLHLSQAVGTKTIAIFGSTDPYIWFPYSVPEDGDYIYSNLECSPCAKKRCDSLECLKNIKVEDVFMKIKGFLWKSKSLKSFT